MEDIGNPCFTCPTNCCAPVRGLKVTAPEFERCFAHAADRFEIEDHGAYLTLTSREGKPCPNFRDNKCGIYDIRPMECRLFPYTVERITEHRANPAVTMHVHSRVQCPAREALLPSRETARTLIEGFAAEAYPGRPADIRFLDPVSAFHLKVMRGHHRLDRLVRTLGAKRKVAAKPVLPAL